MKIIAVLNYEALSCCAADIVEAQIRQKPDTCLVTVTGMLLVRLTTGVFLTLPSTAAVSPSVTSATSFATGNCTYVLG